MTEKKQALVTGANKGIGLSIVKGLAEQGMTVWLGARDLERGEKAVAKLRNDGLDVRLLVIDVADDTSVNQAATRLSDEIETLHVLVNNAGSVLSGNQQSRP
jgi:NAD(P)-dependent dehydrogenase (short-subunit alcohol dehydrogenase family)